MRCTRILVYSILLHLADTPDVTTKRARKCFCSNSCFYNVLSLCVNSIYLIRYNWHGLVCRKTYIKFSNRPITSNCQLIGSKEYSQPLTSSSSHDK